MPNLKQILKNVKEFFQSKEEIIDRRQPKYKFNLEVFNALYDRCLDDNDKNIKVEKCDSIEGYLKQFEEMKNDDKKQINK